MLKPFVAACILALAALAHAQSTAFTYQGELKNGGSPATGLHDFRFRLYDAVSGGGQQGPTLCANNVSVSNGRFTIPLDFGAQFNGSFRCLEIEVRADTGQDCSVPAGFTILGPRQEITPAPDALFALNAAAASNATQLNGQAASFYTNAANLTGTVPDARLTGSYTSALNLTNAANAFAGSGAGLTSLNAASLASGTVPDARLGGAYSNAMSFSNASNSFVGSGFGLTLLNASSLFTGTVPDARLPSTVARLGTSQTFTAGQEFNPGSSDNACEFRCSGPTLATILAFATATTGNAVGVLATSSAPSGVAVRGTGTSSTGDNFGGYFLTLSNSGVGCYGEASATTGTARGLYGVVRSNDSVAVQGEVVPTTGTSTGVWGISASGTGYGVFATGRLGATGTKTFRIDHPLDPTNKWLLHYCAEGPEPLNVYSGVITTDAKGEASITLPDYFESINRDPRVQLTIEDESDDFVMAKVVGGVKDGSCRVRTTKPLVKVYWEIKAVRNDLWVRTHGAPVEEAKSERERGTYQHPEFYGLPHVSPAASRSQPFDPSEGTATSAASNTRSSKP